jgi:shikimate kinase
MKIFLIGFMGSGKSHWGKRLSDRLRLPYFDLDEVIVAAEGRPITEIFASDGEEYFRWKEQQLLEKYIDENSAFVCATGGGTPCFFNNIELMKKAGIVVWLNTALDVLVQRLVKEKEKRPLIREVSDAELRSFILKKMNDRRLYYEQADLHIDEDQITLDDLLKQIIHE